MLTKEMPLIVVQTFCTFSMMTNNEVGHWVTFFAHACLGEFLVRYYKTDETLTLFITFYSGQYHKSRCTKIKLTGPNALGKIIIQDIQSQWLYNF